MKILNKYLIKQSLLPFTIGLGGFIVFVSVELLYQLSDIIVSYRISFYKLLIVLYYNLPYFTVLGIPVGLLLAIFWVLSQLSSEHEIMAFQVHGFSSKKLVIPFLILSIILSVCAYLLNDFLVPSYNMKANQALRRYIYKRPEVTVKTNTFFKGEEGKYFYVKTFDIKKELFRDVIIYDVSSKNTKVITAKIAYKKGKDWYLKDGRIFTVNKNGFLSLDMTFDEMQMDIKEDIERFIASQKTPRDMTTRELKEKIKTFKKLGLNVSHFVVEYHSKFAVSLGPLIIALLGVPLSLIFDIKSKSWGVLLTFVLIVFYQGSGAWLAAMGKEEIIDPVLSAWLPDIFFSTVGIVIFVFLDTPLMYRFKEKIGKYLGISAILFMFIFPTQSFSQSDVLKISSDNFLYQDQRILLWGNVRIEKEGTILKASTVTAFLKDEKVKSLEAIGNVEYQIEDRVYKSKKLEINFDESKAFVWEIRGKSDFREKGKKKNVFIYGEKAVIDMEKNNYTRVYKGYVTTCDKFKPHYRFQAQYIEIFPNDKLIAYNVLMYIFEIPVMYYPVYFMSLKYPKQPLELSVSNTSKNGWIISMGFNFPLEDEDYGTVGFEWIQKGDDAGTTSFFNFPYKISDDLSWTTYFKDFNPKDSKLHNRTLKTAIEKRLSKNLTMSIFYEQNRDTDFVSEDTRNIIRGLKISGKISKGSFNVAFQDKSSLGKESFVGSLFLPSISVSKIKHKIDLFGKELSINLSRFSYDFEIPYSSKESFSESFFNYTNRTLGTANFSISNIDLIGPLKIKGISSSYVISQKMTGEGKLDFLLKNDNSLYLNPLTYSPINGTSFSTSYGLMLGCFVTEAREEKGYRLANTLNSSLNFNSIPNVSVKLQHSFVKANGENSASFKYNRDVNLLKISDEFSIPFVNLRLGSSISYDFEKEEKNWSDLSILSQLPWSVFGIQNTLKATTFFDVYDKKFIKTNYVYSLKYKNNLYFSTDFNYIYDQEKPIDKFVNKLNFSIREFGNLRSLSFNSESQIKVDPVDLEYLKLRMTSNFSDWSNQTDIILRNKQLSFTSSYNFKGLSIKTKSAMITEPLRINTFSLALEKDLHCWEGSLSLDLKYGEDGLKFDKFVLEFHIKDLPDKSIKIYPIDRQVEFGLF